MPLASNPASWVPRQSIPLKARVLQVLDGDRYHCEYQPIVEASSGRIVAYEALARFEVQGEEVAPNLVFGSLRNDPTLFFLVESKLKAFQLKHRPIGAALFVNLDPMVCTEAYQVSHWTQLFRDQDHLVVELLENTQPKDLQAVQSFVFELAQCDVLCAIDDLGGPQTLVCFDLVEQCGYVKLDRRWFWRYEHDVAYRPLLSGLVAFARARGIGTVLEGVETTKQLELARELGVDCVQGFLFQEHTMVAPRNGGPEEARPAREPAENVTARLRTTRSALPAGASW